MYPKSEILLIIVTGGSIIFGENSRTREIWLGMHQ